MLLEIKLDSQFYSIHCNDVSAVGGREKLARRSVDDLLRCRVDLIPEPCDDEFGESADEQESVNGRLRLRPGALAEQFMGFLGDDPREVSHQLSAVRAKGFDCGRLDQRHATLAPVLGENGDKGCDRILDLLVDGCCGGVQGAERGEFDFLGYRVDDVPQ